MTIKNITNNVEQTEENGIQVFSFGEIPHNSDASFQLEAKGTNLTNLTIVSTCSCTAPKIETVDKDTVNATIRYKNTHKLQPFSVILNYAVNESGVQKQGKIKIKGKVV